MNGRLHNPIRLCAAVMLAILAGCASVGPDYAPPGLPAGLQKGESIPFEFTAGQEGVSDSPLPDHWWRLYDDARLDQLVQQGLAANADLRVAAANLDRAAAALREAGAAGSVQTTLSGGVSRGQESALGVAPSAGTHGLVDIGLGFSYDLDIAGRIRRMVQATQADTQAQAAAYDLARTAVAGNVVAAYTDACAAGAQLAVARHSVALQRQSLALTRRSAGAGMVGPMEVMRSRTLLAQLQATLPPLQAERRVALYTLATLTGHAPADIPAGLSECSTLPRLAQAMPVGDGAALIRRRPDIRQAERALAAATARIGVEVAGLYPTVTLGAGLGTTAMDSGDSFSKSAFHYSIGPLISWTMPNRAVARARIDEAGASARAALATFDSDVLNALREAQTALTTYARHQQENERLGEARDTARQTVALQRQLGQGGTISPLDVLEAERTLAQTEGALAASNATLARDRVHIFMALGGGWER